MTDTLPPPDRALHALGPALKHLGNCECDTARQRGCQYCGDPHSHYANNGRCPAWDRREGAA